MEVEDDHSPGPVIHGGRSTWARGLCLSLRAAQAALAVLMCAWVFGSLGGLRLSPSPGALPGTNDTGQIFNWHPLLVTLAFPLLMAEAVLAYRAPLAPLPPHRAVRKAYHGSLQASAAVAAILAVSAAIVSHTHKLPDPIPNFYSAHSVLGATVTLLLVVQVRWR